MVNYAIPAHPYGVMLTVERPAANDWQGDPANGTVTTHQIGPCVIKWLTDTEDNSSGELLMLAAQVTAPSGSNVLEGDDIRHPNGRLFAIDGQVRETPNPTSGYTAGVRFVMAKDGGNGVRQR